MTLEDGYYWSQIFASAIQTAVFLAAVWAGFAAYRQVDALKLFELLKYTQDEDFREARRIVIREICPIHQSAWWTNDEFESAASKCCASYDILARILRFNCGKKLRGFFIGHWKDSILRTWMILEPFISARRASGGNEYSGYEWLKNEVVASGYQIEDLGGLC